MSRPLAVLCCCLAFAGSSVSLAQEVLFEIAGEASGDLFGLGVGSAGDVDADGIPDLLLGAFNAALGGPSSGGAWLYSGLDGRVLESFAGQGAGDWFGRRLSYLGDVDGDGHDDFAVASTNSDEAGLDRGLVVVYSGCDRSVLYRFHGQADEDHLGWAIRGAGDVNGDGVQDILASAHDHITQAQADSVIIWSGCDGSVLHRIDGEWPGHTLGTAVAPLGDLNGDGYDDVLVGAAFDDRPGTNAGSVRVYSGRDATLMFHLDGEEVNGRFGFQLDGIGDVNRDGTPDFLVGSNGSNLGGTSAGTIVVYSGADASVLYDLVGPSAGASLGNCAGVGDVNGDGHADFLIGAPGANGLVSGAGSAWLYSGATGSELYRFRGDQTGESMGRDVAAAGDMNGDGTPDLLIVAPRRSAQGVAAGVAFVFAGRELFLQAQDPSPSIGQTLRLTTRGGGSGQPAAMFLAGVDGIPVFRLVQLGTLNRLGNLRFTATVPSGLGGVEGRFLSLSFRSDGKQISSAEETVQFP